MARDLTTAFKAAAADALVRPVLLLEGVFATGTLRLWTGVGTLSWNGQSWTGGGNLVSIAPMEETAEIRAAGVAISLSGMPSENVALALQSVRTGLAGTVYLALLDASNAVIGDPMVAFSGRLDASVMEDAGQTATITVTYESRLIDLERSRERRYTDEDQQFEYAGDRGFEYVAGLQDKVIQWGR